MKTTDEQLNELLDWIKALSERVLALELLAIRAGLGAHVDAELARMSKNEREETK